ncbi:MAG: prepilin-type N-terminal cleavage/methylation domain-containing protein [Lachnospiraceae bacterium]|nr:prepilin-type N-terminal cleavage/methylation domain-containing protein [Lachnospiraceae bacterium]
MMKRRMKKLNNDGYSLVEMIIVIAIIAVMTAAAVITVNTIQTAKAKEASMSFESAVKDLHSTTKGKAYDFDGDGDVNDVDDQNLSFGLRIYDDGSKCYIQKVIVKNGVYEPDATYEKDNNLNKGKGTSLSSYVYVTYSPIGGAEKKIDDSSYEALIYYGKDGTCKLGVGTYKFYRDNGSSIATVNVNKNGSVISK